MATFCHDYTWRNEDDLCQAEFQGEKNIGLTPCFLFGCAGAGALLSLGSGLENLEDHDLDDENGDGWCQVA